MTPRLTLAERSNLAATLLAGHFANPRWDGKLDCGTVEAVMRTVDFIEAEALKREPSTAVPDRKPPVVGSVHEWPCLECGEIGMHARGCTR